MSGTRIPVRAESPAGSACLAPTTQLHLNPDGRVDACCMATYPLGHIGEQTLRSVWEGLELGRLRGRLADHDYTMGCTSCAREIALEGRPGSVPAQYDVYADEFPDGAVPAWPRRLDFMLSNNCNLQCVQCSGTYSSAIRAHREKLPPLPNAYPDAFFEELRAFLPHLELATFEGGEPFLAEANFRVWRMIEEVAPDLSCVITTNGTQFTRRVEHVVTTLQAGIIVSLDGATAPVYEAIRIGSDFEKVMANTRRLFAIAQAKGQLTGINFCMMPGNAHEFGPLLALGDELGADVSVAVVRTPREQAIFQQPQDQIREVVARFDREDARWRAELGRNREAWIRETERVRAWAAADLGDLDRSRHARILDLETMGRGPTDVDAVRREELALAAGHPVHELTIGYDDLIEEAPLGLAEVLGDGARDLVGRHVSVLEELAARTFATRRLVSSEHGEDLAHHITALDGMIGRNTMVAVRDEDGFARQVKMFVTIRPA